MKIPSTYIQLFRLFEILPKYFALSSKLGSFVYLLSSIYTKFGQFVGFPQQDLHWYFFDIGIYWYFFTQSHV